MTPTLHLVATAALLTWIAVLFASFIRNQGWTLKGVMYSFSNRDTPPTPSALAGRADRMAANTLENFVIFAALALTANAVGTSPHQVESGAVLYLWARIIYIPVYLIGIPYLRTAAWAAGAAGMIMILLTLL